MKVIASTFLNRPKPEFAEKESLCRHVADNKKPPPHWKGLILTFTSIAIAAENRRNFIE